MAMSSNSTIDNDAEHCPRCAEKGKIVSLATVGAMAKAQVEAAKLSRTTYRLCRNLKCPVVYFAAGIAIDKTELRVPVNFKEENYKGPVCYCFNHIVASIRAEIQSSGRSTVQAMITKEIKAGRCDCEVKNPAGSCCLGDVTRAIQAVRAQLKGKTDSKPGPSIEAKA
jgi:Zinc binding domain